MDPSEEREVEEADAMGESPGVLTLELRDVEGTESRVVVRRYTVGFAVAVVLLILAVTFFEMLLCRMERESDRQSHSINVLRYYI
jgi:hypothetical protein